MDSGRFSGLYVLITGTSAFFDGPQGIQRLEPLAQRLHVDFQSDVRFDNPRAVRVFVDGGDNSELPISLAHARTLHAIFKREFLRRDDSARNLMALVARRSVGMEDTTRRHTLVPFPAYEGFQNRTRPVDFLRKHFEDRLKENNGRFDMPEEVYTEAGANIKVMSD